LDRKTDVCRDKWIERWTDRQTNRYIF
jgi:hypothetical protein